MKQWILHKFERNHNLIYLVQIHFLDFFIGLELKHVGCPKCFALIENSVCFIAHKNNLPSFVEGHQAGIIFVANIFVSHKCKKIYFHTPLLRGYI